MYILVGHYEPLELFCLWTKVQVFFSPNVKGVLVDKILFRFAICRSVPEIFAIKVESCQKLRRILDVFSPSQILGGRSSKSYDHVMTSCLVWKKFCKDTPTSPEVIGDNSLNFCSNFKCMDKNKIHWFSTNGVQSVKSGSGSGRIWKSQIPKLKFSQ